MMEAAEKPKAKRGRTRIHRDDAERQAARQERLRTALAEAEMLRTVLDTPTPKMMERTGRCAMKYAERKNADLAEYAIALFQSFLLGVERGGGQNVAQALRNFVTHEKLKAAEPVPDDGDDGTWNLV